MKAYNLHTELMEFYLMVKENSCWSVISRDGHVLVSRETDLATAFRLAVLRSKMWVHQKALVYS